MTGFYKKIIQFTKIIIMTELTIKPVTNQIG